LLAFLSGVSHVHTSIQTWAEFRVEEIERHLDICAEDENIAHSIQINS
jgi:hypothetical protein